MAEDRVALNLRLPASLHQGLVALAKRDYRSLNDQIVSMLARAILDALDPQRDTWPQIVTQAARRLEPFISLWAMRYPEQPLLLRDPQERVPVIATSLVDRIASPTNDPTVRSPEPTQEQRKRIEAQDRLERACAEFVWAFRAWEQLNQQRASSREHG